MTQTEPNDWTQIASQLLQEAAEIRVRFETVADVEERQRLRDRYFQIDRLLALAHQMTQGEVPPVQAAPSPVPPTPSAPSPSTTPYPVSQTPVIQEPHVPAGAGQMATPVQPAAPPINVQAAAAAVPAPVVPQAGIGEIPQPMPETVLAESASPEAAVSPDGQPFYFERAEAAPSPDGREAVPSQTPDFQPDEEDVPDLVVEVAGEDEARGPITARFDPADEVNGEQNEEQHGTETGSRPRVNVRHVRRIGPKLERQSKNRPLSKRALNARVRLGEMSESEAQAVLAGAETPGAESGSANLESVEGVPLTPGEDDSSLPIVVPDFHKEFVEFPPPELPKQAPPAPVDPPVASPAPPPVAPPVQPAPPPVMPAVAVAPLAPEPPIEPAPYVPQSMPASAAPAPPTWPLYRPVEPAQAPALPAAPPAAQAVPGVPPGPAVHVRPVEVLAPDPEVIAGRPPSEATPVEDPMGEALPFTPLSQRIRRVAPSPRIPASPAASALQRIQARAKEDSARPTPRDVRKRVLEAGDRLRPGSGAPTGSPSNEDRGPATSRPRWSFGSGETPASTWQGRHESVAEPPTAQSEAADMPQTGPSGIRPKLRPGEVWTAPPVLERSAPAEVVEETVNRISESSRTDPARVKTVEPLVVPSVPSTPPADWSGPVVLPVARRSVEEPAYRPRVETGSVFAQTPAEPVEAVDPGRPKTYNGALALPATTRDTPDQYSAWMERAAHETYVVRRQYCLIRAYLERYGGPFTREVIVLRHLQKAEAIDDFLAMKYYALLALTEVAKLVRGGSTSEIEVILLHAEEDPVWEKKAEQALVALYMLVKPKRTEYETLAEKEREKAADEPASSDRVYCLLRAMMTKRIGAIQDHMGIRRVFDHAQDEWLVWEPLVGAAYEALLEVDLFQADALTRVAPAVQT